jgi:hypothetical protein
MTQPEELLDVFTEALRPIRELAGREIAPCKASNIGIDLLDTFYVCLIYLRVQLSNSYYPFFHSGSKAS